MERAPLLSPPLYIDGAKPAEVAPIVKAACHKAAPIASLLGATALGVTAAYFAPKFFDWALATWRGRADDDDGEIDLEVE